MSKMIILKTLILGSIFATSTIIGIKISNKYKDRTTELCEMKEALNYFITKLEYTYEPLKDIFIEISNNIKSGIGGIFRISALKMEKLSAKDAWEYSIKLSETNLNAQDLEIINKFGNTLGQTDFQGQINQTRLTLNFLDKQIEEARNEESKNKKLYRTLGILTGAGLVVILI